MIAPEGYTSFIDASFRLAGALPSEFFDRYNSIIKTEDEIDEFCFRDFIEDLIFSRFSEKLRICSNTGLVFKVNQPMLCRGLIGATWMFESIGVDLYLDKSIFQIVNENKINFAFINPDTLIYRLKSGEINQRLQQHLRFGYGFMPMFYNRSNYSIDCSGYKIAKRFGIDRYEDETGTYKSIKLYDGWHICVPDEAICGGNYRAIAENMLDALNLDKYRKSNSGAAKVGRPAHKRKAAGEAYKRLYPDGHGDTQLLVVLRKINGKIGIDISPETLRRAISDLEGDA